MDEDDTHVNEALNEPARRQLVHLPLDRIVPSKTNPRLDLDVEGFQELKRSIHINGLLQPIAVRPAGERYEILGGHRRFAAFVALARAHPKDRRFKRIAASVTEVEDALVPLVQLAENVNRADLNALEIGEGIAQALAAGLSHERVTATLGWKPRNTNRYLQIQRAPSWLKACARGVKVGTRRRDDAGRVLLDEAGDAIVDIVQHPPLPFAQLFELVTLFNVLEAQEADAAKNGVELLRPSAEVTVRRLVSQAATQQWTTAKMRAAVAHAKDPSKSPRHRKPPPPIVDVINGRCVVDIARAGSLSDRERALVARSLTEVLAAFHFTHLRIVA